MNCLSELRRIRESILKVLVSKLSEDESVMKKFVKEMTGNVERLYGMAEVCLNPSEGFGRIDEIRGICIDLLNDTAFLKAALDEGALRPVSYLEVLKRLSETGFSCLRTDVRKEIAEILSTNEKVRKYLEDGYDRYGREVEVNRKLLSLVKSLDPEYDVTDIIRRIAVMTLRNTEVKDEKDLFKITGAVFAWNFYSRYSKYMYPDDDFKKYDEIFSFFNMNFFREKVLDNKCFKRLPEFFQKIIRYEHGALFNEPGSDAEKIAEDLKKDIDLFLSELNKIAKNGGKPSDYYAGKPFWPQGRISDPKSYLVTLVFRESIYFLESHYGCWKALKPMLTIFRSLKEQAYYMGLQRQDAHVFSWSFVPVSITQFLGSMDENETEKVCEEWFEYLGKQLRSADDFEVKKRTENPEKVPEKFRSGYDIKVIEPHPVWREAYCEAAGDLGVNLGFDKCRIFNHLKKDDIDENVRKAAGKTLERVEKIKGRFDSASRKRALLNAWWWYRIAHLRSLGIDFDWNAAQNRKRLEATFYYPGGLGY
ncbi:hypothetical protein J5690_01960 [bacterium]|nr:hypothetical protein [bacterium]